jgi:hypothetical protein
VVPYNERYILPGTNLGIQHSPPSYAKTGAMTSLEKDVDMSSIYGCSHRIQHAARTGKSGKIYDCWFNGWLGSTDLTKEHKRVFSYAKNHTNWQSGASIVGNHAGHYWVNQFQIIDYKAMVNGYLYGG